MNDTDTDGDEISHFHRYLLCIYLPTLTKVTVK